MSTMKIAVNLVLVVIDTKMKHKDLNDFDKDRHDHKDNDFVRDEADKLKDKKITTHININS